MKKRGKICLMTQARLGSQRVPQKMIKPFAGTSLIDIALGKLEKSRSIHPDDVYISVYEEELKNVVRKYNVNIFHRSKESAFSEGESVQEIYEWWKPLMDQGYEYVVMVNACCPLLPIETIDGFIEAYIKSPHNGLFGVVAKKNYFWDKEGNLITNWNRSDGAMNTKVVEETYEAAHCLYAGKLEDIGNGIWMGDYSINNPSLYIIENEEEIFDIDYHWQFKQGEILYLNR